MVCTKVDGRAQPCCLPEAHNGECWTAGRLLREVAARYVAAHNGDREAAVDELVAKVRRLA